jgi:hypothetical protein
MLKHPKYTCPFCEHVMSSDDITEVTDKYFKCTSPTCPVVFIPRDAGIRQAVVKAVRERYRSKYECLKCNRSYVPFAVSHSDAYSVCPGCHFEDPLEEYTRDCVKPHFQGKYCSSKECYFPRCESCNRFYDPYRYSVVAEDPEDYEEYEVFLCCECVDKQSKIDGISYEAFTDGSGCGGNPCKLLPIRKYSRVELDDCELHKLSLFYLPSVDAV